MPQHFITLEDLLAATWPEAVAAKPPVEALRGVAIAPASLTPDPVLGMTFDTSLLLKHRVEVGVPGVDLITLGVGGSNQPVRLVGTLYPDQRFLFGPVPVTVLIRHELLVPVKRGPKENGIRPFVVDESTDQISVVFEGAGVSYSPERGMRLRSPASVAAPPFKIRGLDLILGFDGLSLVLRDADWTPALGDLGFEPGFRGLHAHAAVLYWLPELTLNGVDFPGLRLDFHDVALGDAGVSFKLDLTWETAFDDAGVLDPAHTEMYGSFMSEAWQVAVQRASGVVRANVPESFEVTALLRTPFFDALFAATFGMSYEFDESEGKSRYATSLRIAKASADPIEVDHGVVRLSLTQFDAHGLLSSDGFSIEGMIGFEASIHGFEVAAESAAVAFSHLDGADAFSFTVANLTLGDLGTVSEAVLQIEGSEGNEGYSFEKLRIVADYTWKDLEHIIPADLPGLGLPDDGHVRAEISWLADADDPSAQVKVVVELLTEATHIDDLWGFVPPAFRPEVRSMRSFFRVTYDSVDAFTADTRDESKIHVELSSRLELKLPDALLGLDVPGLDLFEIRSGDNDGFLAAEYRADFKANDENEVEFSTGLHVENPIAIDVNLPGARSEEPFIAVSLDKVGLLAEVSSGDPDDHAPPPDDDDELQVGGRLLFEGGFQFRPLVPASFPFAEQFNSLLRGVGLDEVIGSAKLDLGFKNDSFDMALSGEFADFGIELDVFDMVAALAGGGGAIGGVEIDIDFEIGFRLIGFEIQVSRDPDAEPGEEYAFSFDLTVEVGMTGVPPMRARMRLSDDEFSLGVIDLMIPLEIPRYPISVQDFDVIEDNGVWSQAKFEAYSALIDSDIADLDAAIDGAGPSSGSFERVKQRARLQVKKALLQIVMEIHELVGPSGHAIFQSLVYADTFLHESVLDLIAFDPGIRLHFPEIKIKIPFDDPAGIAISGSGRFDVDTGHWLEAIRTYELEVGLSAEYIFLRMKSDGTAIPLPALGTKYDDGSVAINSLSIAYGYSKNSFAFDFSGEFVIPTNLIEDADTSDNLGIGVRLPRHNKLYFKLDTVVFTVGKVTLVIPLPQFDVDLRSPGAPGLVWDGGRRRPYWDGFEFIVPGVIHTDFKRLAFSPFFGFFLLPNFKYDGDLELGDDYNGLTLIADDFFILLGLVMGSSGILTIPILAEPLAPYFENLVGNVRVAGFEINFNLQRPFPSPSPLALIELFGLLSNPAMEVKPDGALANIVRFQLDNAYVRVPEFVTQMFPAAAGLAKEQFGFVLNVGTLITAVQSVVGTIGPLIDAVKSAGDQSLADLSGAWETAAEPFDPWSLVAALPPELRKFRLGGQIAGFSASACLVIATTEEARASFKAVADGAPLRRPAAGPALPPAGAASPSGDAASQLQDALASAPPDFKKFETPASSLEGRRVVGDESLTLMTGIEFRQFTADDLDLIPTDQLDLHDPAAGGVMIAAYVRVFGAQKIRFLGRLFENGSFALISAAEAQPLRLAVFGIPVELPFTGYGRLGLAGGQKRSGPWGQIRAEGVFDWTPIPGVLRIQAGDDEDPVRLHLHSNGHFRLESKATVTLFDGAAMITGSVAASHEKVAVAGRLLYQPASLAFPELLEIDISGAGAISAVAPGTERVDALIPSFSFEARGAVKLLGQSFAGVGVRVTNHEAAFDLSFNKPVNHGASTPLEAAFPILKTCQIKVTGRGRANLRRPLRPDFDLEGEGTIKLLGAEISGKGSIRARPAPGASSKNDWFEASMEGDLRWQNQRWLGGKLLVGSDGLFLQGATSFGLKITPSQIPGPAAINLAHLFVAVNMDGSFSLDRSAGSVSFQFKGDWMIGVGLPDSGSSTKSTAQGGQPQMIPLASSSFTFCSAISDQTPLLSIDGFSFLPWDKVTLPVPKVTVSKADNAKTMVRAGKLKNKDNVSAVELWTPFGRLGLEEAAVPIPYYSASGKKMKGTVRKVYSAYKTSVEWSSVELDVTKWSDLDIFLRLRESGGQFPLKIVLESGSGGSIEVGL